MNIAVVGSRDYPLLERVAELVSQFGKCVTVVSGGAVGVDSMAEEAARLAGLATRIFPAHWRVNGLYNPKAGFERNVDIVHAADLILAFWDQESRGTAHTLRLARSIYKPIILLGVQGTVIRCWNLDRLEGEVLAELPEQLRVTVLDHLDTSPA